MPQGTSQWACATVVGRSQLVRRDMGLLASRVLVGGPGDLAAGVCTGGLGPGFAGILQVCGGVPATS